jgi:parvulin-like peptidyl-prolyl isomerase
MQHHRYITIATFNVLIGVLIGVGGCQKTAKDKPAGGSAQGSGQVATGSGSSATAGASASAGSSAGSGERSSAPAVPDKDIDSKDVLARTETSKEVLVKHVLLGWKELAPVYQGRLDPRAAKRTNAEAATLAEEIAGKLKANPDAIDDHVKDSSEDPSAVIGEPYTIKADAPFIPEFKNLALRLKEKEVGIVKTQFGYHVIERVLPPKPDPLDSVDILKREPEPGTVHVQHVLISWKDSPAARAGRADTRALARTKAEADKLASTVLAKVRAKGDMAKLMKEHSEDPATKDTAKGYDVSASAQVAEPFKNLSLRLKLNEAGLIKTPFGWHVIKRVPPPPEPPLPPLDPLESKDILERKPTTASAKVKHILLNWSGGEPQHERAKTRDRATLDKLVKETVGKLKAGDKIEPMMAALSEDPGSVGGTSYDVTPDAGLVEPFKRLSLRLNVGEVGVVKTQFGFHIIQRTE